MMLALAAIGANAATVSTATDARKILFINTLALKWRPLKGLAIGRPRSSPHKNILNQKFIELQV